MDKRVNQSLLIILYIQGVSFHRAINHTRINALVLPTQSGLRVFKDLHAVNHWTGLRRVDHRDMLLENVAGDKLRWERTINSNELVVGE